MFKDGFNSLKTTVFERISSPLAGSIILSWMAWNWKLIYYFIAVSDKVPFQNRIQFITNNFSNPTYLYIWPIISALSFIVAYPFCSSEILKIWLWHKERQRKIKREIENLQTITVEEYAKLRIQIQSQEEEFVKSLDSKNKEINLLVVQKEELQREILELSKNKDKKTTNNDNQKNTSISNSMYNDMQNWDSDFSRFESKTYSNYFDEIYKFCLANKPFVHIPVETISVYDSFGLIKRIGYSELYEITEKGRYFYSRYKAE